MGGFMPSTVREEGWMLRVGAGIAQTARAPLCLYLERSKNPFFQLSSKPCLPQALLPTPVPTPQLPGTPAAVPMGARG